jgi:hypothetical protein
VHDTTELESRGVPSVMVASSEFEGAADAQARALGFEPARVFVRHPIQDRTDEEMRAIADQALEELESALVVHPARGDNRHRYP